MKKFIACLAVLMLCATMFLPVMAAEAEFTPSVTNKPAPTIVPVMDPDGNPLDDTERIAPIEFFTDHIGLTFYSGGKCSVTIGGVTNEGSFTFNETSVDVEYGGKTQKLSYDRGILTLKLDYNGNTTSYMFTKVTK